MKFSIAHIAALLYFSFFIPSVYSSHMARWEDAGLPESLSMVTFSFSSSQTQVSISSFHIDHK